MGNKKGKKKYVISSKQIFDREKPKWNGFQIGNGVHGDISYNRKKTKRDFNKFLNENEEF